MTDQRNRDPPGCGGIATAGRGVERPNHDLALGRAGIAVFRDTTYLAAGPASEHRTRLRRDTTGRNLKEKKAAEGGLKGGRHSRERDWSRAERECPDAPARSPPKPVLGPEISPSGGKPILSHRGRGLQWPTAQWCFLPVSEHGPGRQRQPRWWRPRAPTSRRRALGAGDPRLGTYFLFALPRSRPIVSPLCQSD